MHQSQIGNKKQLKSQKGSRTRQRVLLGTGVFVLVVILFVVSIYGYYLHRYDKEVKIDQSFADNWEALSDETTPEREKIAGEPSAKPVETQKIEKDESPLEYIDKINEPLIRELPSDPDVENILLLGVDGGDMDRGSFRSDTMIIVSFHKKDKTIRAVSLMRDIWAYYPNRGGYDKLNAAFAYGGPGHTVNIINENFSLDIQKYIMTDFDGLRNLVDIVGDIEMEITNAEARQINGISSGGKVTLNGVQALAYARIRSNDSDFSRVQRQRDVITAMLRKFMKMTPQKQLSSVDQSLKYVRSNISASQITGDLLDLVRASSSAVKQMTVPEREFYSIDNGRVWYMSLDWDGQTRSLHRFLFERD